MSQCRAKQFSATARYLRIAPPTIGHYRDILIWTLVEYSAHRFLFHSLYRREHWTHHVDVLAYIGVSSWKTSSTFAALLLLVWFTGLTSAFIGAVVGYFYYISAHYVMHRPQYCGLLVYSRAGGQS